jgi:hypothetical protein
LMEHSFFVRRCAVAMCCGDGESFIQCLSRCGTVSREWLLLVLP